MTKEKLEASTPGAKQGPADLELAHEIHSLAQVVYGRLSAMHPWLTSFATPSVFSAPREWPPVDPRAAAWSEWSPWTP